MSGIKSFAPFLIGLSLVSLFLLAALSTQAATSPTATISVTSSSGGTGGPDCTLRDAITTANTATNTGGCVLVGAGSPVTITLDAVGPYVFTVIDNNTNGDNALPAVTGAIVIQGNGRTVMRSSAGGTPSFRLFYVSAGAHLTIADLVIANGWYLLGNGGGIYNDGTLSVVDSTIEENGAGDGGGIANFGTLTVTNSILSSNEGWNCFHYPGRPDSSPAGAGPLAARSGIGAASSGGGSSGGIANQGLLTLVGSTLSGNYSICYGGGMNNTGTATIIDSLFSGNIADVGDGGAIYNDGGTLTIMNSTLSDNASYCCDGGGIFNMGSLLVTGSSFISNTSEFIGGGIANNGTLTVTDTTLRSNWALFRGGGISSSNMAAVTGSTFDGNWVSDADSFNTGGGGIYNGGMLTVANSTLSGNWVSELGEGWGGGISNDGTLMVFNSTLSNNWADDGGGGVRSTGTFHLSNTIIANSPSGGDCLNTGSTGANIANLIEDGSCSPALSGDPLLGPLQDNGGPAWTHALLDLSPALDVGDAAVCALSPVNGLDQRGITRPQGPGCDIGAFEREVEMRLYLPVIMRPE